MVGSPMNSPLTSREKMSTATPEERRVEELKLQIATLREERNDLQAANDLRRGYAKEQRRRVAVLTRTAKYTTREGYTLFVVVGAIFVAAALFWAGAIPREAVSYLSWPLFLGIMWMSYGTRLNRKRNARWDVEDKVYHRHIARLERSLSEPTEDAHENV